MTFNYVLFNKVQEEHDQIISQCSKGGTRLVDQLN